MVNSFLERRYAHLPEFSEGQKIARRDIESGRLKLHVYGDFNPAFQDFAELLRQRYELALEWDFRGEMGLTAWIAGYDHAVDKELSRRLGNETMKGLWREAEEAFKSRDRGAV
jgi:hypothetical protein